MPHVVVKLFPGPSEEQKSALARDIIKAVGRNTGSSEDSVSVAIEEVSSAKWMEKVYHPEIAPAMDRLYKKPGYDPF